MELVTFFEAAPVQHDFTGFGIVFGRNPVAVHGGLYGVAVLESVVAEQGRDAQHVLFLAQDKGLAPVGRAQGGCGLVQDVCKVPEFVHLGAALACALLLAKDKPAAAGLAQPVERCGFLAGVQADFPAARKVETLGVELVKIQAVGVGLGDGQHLGFVTEGAAELGNLLGNGDAVQGRVPLHGLFVLVHGVHGDGPCLMPDEPGLGELLDDFPESGSPVGERFAQVLVEDVLGAVHHRELLALVAEGEVQHASAHETVQGRFLHLLLQYGGVSHTGILEGEFP